MPEIIDTAEPDRILEMLSDEELMELDLEIASTNSQLPQQPVTGSQSQPPQGAESISEWIKRYWSLTEAKRNEVKKKDSDRKRLKNQNMKPEERAAYNNKRRLNRQNMNPDKLAEVRKKESDRKRRSSLKKKAAAAAASQPESSAPQIPSTFSPLPLIGIPGYFGAPPHGANPGLENTSPTSFTGLFRSPVQNPHNESNTQMASSIPALPASSQTSYNNVKPIEVASRDRRRSSSIDSLEWSSLGSVSPRPRSASFVEGLNNGRTTPGARTPSPSM